jgi:hypothetical protein
MIMLWHILMFLYKKEVKEMAVIYVALIIKGKRTFASVPETLKEAVRTMLKDLDLESLIVE